MNTLSLGRYGVPSPISVGNALDTTLPTPAAANDGLVSDNLVIDATTATVASVGIPAFGGTYGVGGIVTIEVYFGEAVTLNTSGGTPTLQLSDGATASYITGTSGLRILPE